ncbi:Gfo/Idh/MocA family oxidoreductase [Maribellus sp. YY47]|uniref:Gfo/Idh/MocA family protein n=1 Tax=Maribellus sp. YY47 TaxID=2929486 RepID=UPI00200195E0|nr:Gfo/Idh/MocA family oxidoreductase [Maribellus sp. YY47]MCK3683965.1 Gfo/Idh/MocA family oxidoreductase [Maribellus sp. YY47]
MGKKKENDQTINRRNFIRLGGLGVGAGLIGVSQIGCTSQKKTDQPVIQGFEDTGVETSTKIWQPVSDRKIRVGLVGYGVCKFSAAFGFQNHPNVDVVAVSDLIPERCEALAKEVGCNKTYPSLEEMVKDDNIEAIFVATDAPNHARHCIEVLNHGKHVATAVPAVFGSLEDAEKVFETVKRTGLKYMMFETSMFRQNLYEMRQLYNAGALGDIIYTEGEYWHYSANGIAAYKNWRSGMPPQWYPTHSDAYYVGVTNGSFIEVSCMGIPGKMERYNLNNQYGNPFATEISLYRTNGGSMARMGRSADTYGEGYGSETGRVRGTKGSYYDKYEGIEKTLPDLARPALPPGVPEGGHGGSHGRLMDEFVTAILQDRKPLVDVAMALNMTVGGIVAHQSAMKDGELLKIPQFKYWE